MGTPFPHEILYYVAMTCGGLHSDLFCYRQLNRANRRARRRRRKCKLVLRHSSHYLRLISYRKERFIEMINHNRPPRFEQLERRRQIRQLRQQLGQGEFVSTTTLGAAFHPSPTSSFWFSCIRAAWTPGCTIALHVLCFLHWCGYTYSTTVGRVISECLCRCGLYYGDLGRFLYWLIHPSPEVQRLADRMWFHQGRKKRRGRGKDQRQDDSHSSDSCWIRSILETLRRCDLLRRSASLSNYEHLCLSVALMHFLSINVPAALFCLDL